MVGLWTWIALWASSAVAADPAVSAAADGSVTGALLIAADADRLRGLINGPVMRGDFSPDVYSVVATPDGPCQQLDTATRGVWRPLRVRSRWCPTATGFENSLIQSDDFSSYHAVWTLTTVSGGTAVEVRMNTAPRVSVPQGLITEVTRQSVSALLIRLAKEAVSEN